MLLDSDDEDDDGSFMAISDNDCSSDVRDKCLQISNNRPAKVKFETQASVDNTHTYHCVMYYKLKYLCLYCIYICLFGIYIEC